MKTIILLLISLLIVATPCYAERWFQGNSTWYEQIPDDPELSVYSSIYMNRFDDFGQFNIQYGADNAKWGMEICHALPSTPNITVTMLGSYEHNSYAISQGWNIVPIPSGCLPPGNTAACNGENVDGWLTVTSADGHYSWDMYKAQYCNGQWGAYRARRWDRTTAGLNSPYDAHGLIRMCSAPYLHGTLIYNEVLNNTIDHALAFINSHPAADSYGREENGTPSGKRVYPCGETTGYEGCTTTWGTKGCMRVGMRLQLDPTYNCTGDVTLTTFGKRVCEALKKYGMIMVGSSDGEPPYLVTEVTTQWGSQLTQMDSLTSHFRVVLPVCNDPTKCPNQPGGGDPPATPTNFTCTADSVLQKITCSWLASSGATSYYIYRCTGTSCTPTTYLDQTANTSYINDSLTASTTYGYQVTAINGYGESSKTSFQYATTPTQPSFTYIILRNSPLQTIVLDANCKEYTYANSMVLQPTSGGNTLTAKLLYGSSGLYICGTTTDSQLNYTTILRDGSLYVDDYGAFMFDTAHDKGTVNDSDDYKFGINVFGAVNDQNAGSIAWDLSNWDSIVSTSGTLNVNSDVDSSWTFEMFIPWSSEWVSSAPATDTVWGLEIEMTDKDSSATVTKAWANITGTGGYNDPDGWGDMTFSATEVTPGIPTTFTKTVKPSGGDFSTIDACADWFTTNYPNFVTSNIIGACKVDAIGWSADTTCISIAGITTDSTHYLDIYSEDDRTSGLYDTARYRNECTGLNTVTINIANLKIHGLQFYNNNSSASSAPFKIDAGDEILSVDIERNIIRAKSGINQTGRSYFNFDATSGGAGSVVSIRYNLMYDIGDTNTTETNYLVPDTDVTVTADNNTMIGGYNLVNAGGSSGFPYGWGRVVEIKVDHTKVSANLTGYPVLLTETNLPTELCDSDLYGSQGSGPLRVTSDAAGLNQLPLQIVSFTPTADPANCTAEFYVKKDLSSSTDTSIYLWYDNVGQTQLSRSSTYGSDNVWNSNYKGVWHLNETSSTRYDSTSNQNDLAVGGSISYVTTGKIGNAADFSPATSDYLYKTETASLDIYGVDQPITLSAFIKPDGTTTGNIIRKYDLNAQKQYGLQLNATNLIEAFLGSYSDCNTATNAQAPTAVTQAAWAYVSSVYNDSDIRIYRNGTLDSGTNNPKTYTAGICNGSANFAIGASYNTGTPYNFFNGVIDEVRVSNSARSANWITTEYNNLNSPSTFAIEQTPGDGLGGGTGGNAIFRNNIIYGVTQTTTQGGSGTGYNCLNNTLSIGGSNNTTSATLNFTDATNKRYSLRQNSDCVCTGTNLGYVTDIMGRTIGCPTSPTRGAFNVRKQRFF